MRTSSKILIFFICMALVIVTDIFAVFQYKKGTINKNNTPHENLAVFCAGIQEGQGIDLITKKRIQLAHKLTSSHQKIILIGCNWKQIQGKLSMQDYAYKIGIPQSSLIADHYSYDTVSNLQALEAILSKTNIKSLHILTSPLHIMRIQFLQKQHLHTKTNISYIQFNHDKNTFLATWKETHHEWAALTLYFALPKNTYKQLMAYLRKPNGTNNKRFN